MLDPRRTDDVRKRLAEVDRLRAAHAEAAVSLETAKEALARAESELELAIARAAAAVSPSGGRGWPDGALDDLPATGTPQWVAGPRRPTASAPGSGTEPSEATAPEARTPIEPSPGRASPQPSSSEASATSTPVGKKPRKPIGRPFDAATLKLLRFLMSNPRPVHAEMARVLTGRDDRAARNRTSTRLHNLERSDRIRWSNGGWQVIDFALVRRALEPREEPEESKTKDVGKDS